MTQIDAVELDSESAGELTQRAAESLGLELGTAEAVQFPPLSKVKAAAATIALGFLWGALVWWVQYLTTAPTLWKEPSMLVKDLVFRFLLDWSLATVLFSLLSPRIVSIIFVLNLWLAGAVLSFFVNYQRALSWLTVRSQSGEGAAVFMVALADAAPYLGVLVPTSAALVLVFYRLRPRMERQTIVAIGALFVWMMVFWGMNLDHKPLHRLERFESADGIAHGYGYLTTWMAEAYYVSLDGITEEAKGRLKLPVDGLKSVAPVAVGPRIAVIQIESLDDAVVGFKIGGKEVTPRLNQLASQATYLRVQAIKHNGSCDSDFALLFGALASGKMSPYRIPEFPYNLSLVNTLHERGYETSFYHGVNGTFFERREAFKDMNFDRLVFREDVIRELDLKDAEWTLTDGELFRYAGRQRANTEKFFEFIITGTSHTPYRFSLEDFGHPFFAGVRDRHFNYFDTIAYVDKVLGEYIDALPNDTVVMIYGDHWSRVLNEELGYQSQMIDEFGVVPLFLFRKTKEGVSPLVEVESKLARDAQVRLVDVTSWLRKSLKIAPAFESLN